MGFEDVRFRPGFFPYTEPSVEPEIWVDGLGWVEMGGAGRLPAGSHCSVGRYLPGACLGPWREPGGECSGSGLKDLRQLYQSDLEWIRTNPGACAGKSREEGVTWQSSAFPISILERLTGTDKETILKRLPMIGSEIERIEEDHVDVEFFPNRPDLFSVEGAARAMRGFLGIETGLPKYTVKPSGIKFTIDPKLATIRPCLASAVIRNVSFDDESILSVMALQEALHWAVGRGRSKVAIGIHDLDTVTPPFHYKASPRDRKFVPLDFTKELTLDGILAEHPKGKDYAKIVKDFPLFPLIVDNEDHVCSFPADHQRRADPGDDQDKEYPPRCDRYRPAGGKRCGKHHLHGACRSRRDHRRASRSKGKTFPDLAPAERTGERPRVLRTCRRRPHRPADGSTP